jgi:hypothetical protein
MKQTHEKTKPLNSNACILQMEDIIKLIKLKFIKFNL